MTITHTKNTKTECVGYSNELGFCTRLVNYKNKVIDCAKCRFYQVVEDKECYWKQIDKDCYDYGTDFR